MATPGYRVQAYVTPEQYAWLSKQPAGLTGAIRDLIQREMEKEKKAAK